MDAVILLCDYAEAVNGKLYIVGGGWSWMRPVRPFRCSLAMRIATNWSEANLQHKLKVALLDQDGGVVSMPGGVPVVSEATFEVGRPAGMLQGEDVISPVALQYEGLDLPDGGFTFQVEIDDMVVGTVPFRVIKQGVPPE